MEGNSSSKILANLNKNQQAAVSSVSSPLRILAGAGSGKTTVLTRKIAYLINVAKIDSKKILALTFTNKAANEMRERVERLIGPKAKDVTLSTFHSLCYKFLIIEIHNFYPHLKNFSILDSSDQDSIIKDICKNNDINYSSLKQTIKEYISSQKNNGINSLEVIKEEGENDCQFSQQLAYVYNEYEKALFRSKSLDFDDLLIYTKKILEENEETRNKWSQKFDYFLIDEFQDTSQIQYDIFNLLVNSKNVTIVGDPDQTIYTWRGADINFINNFDKVYNNVLTITLDQNYRSTKKILDVANNLIKNNSNRIPKDLVTDNEDGQEVEYFEAHSQKDESQWVVSKIKELINRNENPQNITILYRSNFYTRSLEEELISKNISYKMINGHKFYERAEIKDALAYLRCLYEPNEISLKRIINVPSRKIGNKTLDKLVDFANTKQISLWHSLTNHCSEINLPIETKNRIKQFVKIIDKFQKQIKDKINMSKVLENILNEVGYIKLLEEEIKTNSNSSKLDNVHELIDSIKSLEQEEPNIQINDYLDRISLENIQDDSIDENSINLMTIHSSKGLEFENVFVIGLNEGVFPSYKSLSADEEDGESEFLEEERRLAYVAFTRAKKRLYISSSIFSTWSDKQWKPSRFIKEAKIKTFTSFLEQEERNLLDSKVHKNKIEFDVGDRIIHIDFGEGIILEVESDTIIIEFVNKKFGIKRLLKHHKSIERL